LDDLKVTLVRYTSNCCCHNSLVEFALIATSLTVAAPRPAGPHLAGGGVRQQWRPQRHEAEAPRKRDALQGHLAANGVPTLIYYPQPLHLQKCYADVGWKVGDYPVAESVSSRILPLPMYPELSDAQVDHVIGVIRGFHG
jgi:hypothetical protein